LIPHDGKNDRNGKNGVLCAEIVQKLILQLQDVRRRYCSRPTKACTAEFARSRFEGWSLLPRGLRSGSGSSYALPLPSSSPRRTSFGRTPLNESGHQVPEIHLTRLQCANIVSQHNTRPEGVSQMTVRFFRNTFYCIVILAFGRSCLSTSPAAADSNSSLVSTTQAETGDFTCNQTGTTKSSCSESSGFATAHSAYGDLGVQAMVEGSDSSAEADASFQDTVSARRAPQTGTFVLNVRITGSLVCDIGVSGCGAGLEAYNSVGFSNNSLLLTPANVGPLDFGFNFLFPYSDPSEVPIGIELAGFVFCNNAGTPCISSVNFSDTLLVTGLYVEDANGNIVPGATITSSSGTNYDDINESIPVAEPSSWFLLAFAIVGLFAATVCNRRRFSIH